MANQIRTNPREAVNVPVPGLSVPPPPVPLSTKNKKNPSTEVSLEVIDSTGYTGPPSLLGFYNPQAFILPGIDGLSGNPDSKF